MIKTIKSIRESNFFVIARPTYRCYFCIKVIERRIPYSLIKWINVKQIMQSLKYFFSLVFFFFVQLLAAQNIWPGDVNDNGVVNKVDLLYIGYAFGAEGAMRTNLGETWEAKEAPESWGNNFPNGVNYAYADCNGDGVVNQLDANVVINNLNLTHDDVTFIPDEFPVGTLGENPSCEFINAPSAAPVDQVFNLEIALGSTDLPVEDMSGFTFTLNILPNATGINADTEIKLSSGTWVDGVATKSILEQDVDLVNRQLKVAYTKTDQEALSGSGSIATVSFLIESDVIDLLVIDTVTFMIDSILVLDNDLTPIPIVPNTLKLAIDKELTVNTIETNTTININVFPNPTNGLLILESNQPNLVEISLFDAFGKLVLVQDLQKENLQTVDVQFIPNGLYTAKIKTTNGIQSKKIIKHTY